MKKLLSLIIAIAMMFSIVSAVAEEAGVYDGKLVILFTNDFHGQVMQNNSDGRIGYAELAQYKKDAQATGAEVLLFSAGDDIQGAPIVNLSKGEKAIEFMNLVGYDLMTAGNHEFDWGIDNLLQLKEKMEFPIVVANIYRQSDNEKIFDSNKIFELKNGMKIGVFGITTPETMTKANPENIKNVKILQGEEMFAEAQAQVDELKEKGCNLVVCLAHLGVDDESTGNRSLDLLEKVTGIDLLIDGHSHTLLYEKVGDTLHMQTGAYGSSIGAVIYDGESLKGDFIQARKINSSLSELLSGIKHKDEEVDAVVNSYYDEIMEVLSAKFAETKVLLDGNRAPGVRTQETNLGDFCADAILWAANKNYNGTVDCAITNGGGIRDSIQIGDVTMNDMKTVFPFGNTVQILQLNGAEILEALEAATFSTPEASGAFPQVSGIVFTLDTSIAYEQGEQYPNSTYYAPAKPGSRVIIDTIAGEPFDVDRVYTVATNNFTAAGGDTYYVFGYRNALTGYNTYLALEDALIQYTEEVLEGVIGEQYAVPQGRITIK
ncbi:MAG: bifunctional metallophosphatase/5'-nucleotidase [Christensenellaceae bacterium]|nr:bifunctional metallophosphatase/5'-nucleotidase [Christensenellaceae bacterium]